jgi:predicted PurR-regulated permease PerM
MPNNNQLAITNDTIWRFVGIVLLLVLVFLVKEVLALFFIAIILSSAFDPWVDFLNKFKIPRALGLVLVYSLFILVVGGVIYLLTGPIIEQIKDMSRAFPDLYYKINHWLKDLNHLPGDTGSAVVGPSLAELTNWLSQASSSLFGFVSSLFGGIISFFAILVITFYLTVEEDSNKKFIEALTPVKNREFVKQLVDKMQQRIGYWFRGQLVLSVIIFVAVYIGLSILHVKYALLLALLAGIFEIVPFLGPWLAAIPGVFFAFADSPIKAFWVAILYLIIQQLENQLIVPKVMGRSTGLNPLIVILVILAGGKLGGVLGALLAVPVTTALAVYLDFFMAKNKDSNL